LLLATFAGEMAYYACGLIYYFIMFNFVLTNGKSIGAAELFSVWFLSTVIPDFILCVLASRLGMRLYPVFHSGSRSRGESEE
jgi:biotin transport system substrate-specific component